MPTDPPADRTAALEAEVIRLREALVGWQPIDTAPRGIPRRDGAKAYSFGLLLLYGDQNDPCISEGMRVDDQFFVAGVFHCGGPWDEIQYCFKQTEVFPTHWMPRPAPPAAPAQREAGG